MPKQKTKKTIFKRFKISKTGKILRGHHGARHRKFHKSKRRIRSFRRKGVLKGLQVKFVKKALSLS